MGKYSDDELYQVLTETGRFLKDVVPVEGAEYSLDSILAEFGQSAAEPAPEPAPEPVPEQERPAPEEGSEKKDDPADTSEKPHPEPEEPPVPVTAGRPMMDTMSLRQVLEANRHRAAKKRTEEPAAEEKHPSKTGTDPKPGEISEPPAEKSEPPAEKSKPPAEKSELPAEKNESPAETEKPAPEKEGTDPEETEEIPALEKKAPSRLIAKKRPGWRVILGGQGQREEQKEQSPQPEAEDLRDTKELFLNKKKTAEPVQAQPEVSPPSAVFPEEPEGMHKVPLEQVMSQTVEAVLDQDDAILEQPRPLKERLTEILAGCQEKLGALLSGGKKAEGSRLETAEDTAEPAEETPEPDMEQAAKEEKRRCKKMHFHALMSAVPALLLAVLTILDGLGVLKSFWSRMPLMRCAVPGLLLLAVVLLTAPVWQAMAEGLKRGLPGCELGAGLTALAVLADCAYGVLGRSGGPAPLAAPAAALVWLCQLGLLTEARARWDAFHLADIGGVPPYGVSVTAAGACKQRGTLDGFYHYSHRTDPARKWQKILIPVYLGAATVLAGIVILSKKVGGDPLWIWSAILVAAIPLALPLTGALPLRYLSSRLVKSGSAVAGFAGAKAVSRSRRMVVTDDDLFPPGTVGLNGLKVFGEEIGKVVSYAASMTRACNSQLHPLFEQLLTAEGGTHLPVEDLHFFEEGGIGGTIHGESVIMGSAYFMRKKHVTLPQELKLRTGVFLAVDGALIAIFAIKYSPSRNVEWALRALRRNRIEPVLAVRSCNITPGLLRKRFNLDAKPVYPDVSTRLALSDVSMETAEKSSAIIYREGLMPLTETAVGSRRMLRASRSATVLAWLGGLCGMLLAYYLTGAGAFELMDPLRMLVFQGLWLLPAWLLSGLVKHY